MAQTFKFFIVILCNLFHISVSYKYDLNNILKNIINITNIPNISNITDINIPIDKYNVNETINGLKLRNNTYITPPYLRRKTKFCNIKCNCLFSHNIQNDNICVSNWIKPLGL